MMREASLRVAVLVSWVAVAVAVGPGCKRQADAAGTPSKPVATVADRTPAPASLDGRWRAELASPGGPLPFVLVIDGTSAHVVNADERADITGVRRSGDRVVFEIEHYDAAIEAVLSEDGAALRGEWRKRAAEGTSRLPFAAARTDLPRFAAAADADNPPGAVASVAGTWAVSFTDEDGPFPGVAELEQTGQRVSGTILTGTGDYRYLEGRYDGGLLRLSTFDGAHAFLFVARARPDGSLAGDFWSRDTYHATWTATPAGDDAVATVLPNPYEEVSMTSADRVLRFSFPDLAGQTVSFDDARFRNKVVLVDLFGTWCPNCNDLAPLLSAWHKRYRERGFEVVGLAFEFTGEADRDRRMLQVFRDRYDIEFPLLLAGVSDKAEAAKALPDLSAIKSYPTSVFIGRDGKVHKIHSGFAGPGTGEHYERLVADMEATIEELLNH